MADINPILRQAEINSAQINAGAAALSNNYVNIQDLYNKDITTQTTIGDNKAVIEGVLQAGKLNFETSLRKDALSLAADPEDITGRRAQLADTILSNQDAQTKSLQAYHEKQSINFLEDPLGWLTAQFTINQDVDAYNAATAKANTATDQMQTINKLVDQRAIVASKLQQTVTQASANAATQNASLQASLLADESARQALNANTASIEKLISLNAAQLQQYSTVFDAKNKQEQIGIAQKHLELSQKSFEQQKLEFEQRQADKLEGKSFGEYIAKNINYGLTIMHPDAPSEALTPSNPKLLGIIQGKIPLDGELKKAYDLGVKNFRISPDGKAHIIGTSPSDTLDTLQYKPNLPQDMDATMALFNAGVKKAVTSAAYKTAEASKNVVEATKVINTEVQAVFNEAAAHVKDTSNPYYLPPISEIAKSNPSIAQMPAYKNIIGPAVAAGTDLSDPTSVYFLGINAVKNNQISLNQWATDVAAIYRYGQRVNIASKQIENIGVAPLESYNVAIHRGFADNPTIDLAKSGDIVKAMTRDLLFRGKNFEATKGITTENPFSRSSTGFVR